VQGGERGEIEPLHAPRAGGPGAEVQGERAERAEAAEEVQARGGRVGGEGDVQREEGEGGLGVLDERVEHGRGDGVLREPGGVQVAEPREEEERRRSADVSAPLHFADTLSERVQVLGWAPTTSSCR
jgi:hypothetical protein